jgi:hypothetical protein
MKNSKLIFLLILWIPPMAWATFFLTNRICGLNDKLEMIENDALKRGNLLNFGAINANSAQSTCPSVSGRASRRVESGPFIVCTSTS